MNCAELLRRLTDYDEGALPEELCVEIARHLEECVPCGDLRQDLKDLTRLCRESAARPLPPDLRRRIEELLSR